MYGLSKFPEKTIVILYSQIRIQQQVYIFTNCHYIIYTYAYIIIMYMYIQVSKS